MGNVVAIEKMKEYLRIPASQCDDDANLQMVIAASEAQLSNHLGQTKLLVTSGLTQKYHSGDLIWFTDFRPIVSVTSILDPAGNEITSDFYLLREELGEILFRRIVPVALDSSGAVARWTLTYSAGKFQSPNQVPADLQLAIMMLAARRYQRPEPGIQSSRTLSEGTAYLPNPSNSILPPEVIELVAPHVARPV